MATRFARLEMNDDFIAALAGETGPELPPGISAKTRASLAPSADTDWFAAWVARFFAMA